MFKDITLGTIWVGEVINTGDPLQLGRVKIKVFGKYDELEADVIPWAIPYNQLSSGTVYIPKVGEICNVFFENGDENIPFFMGISKTNDDLLGEYAEDYPKVWSIVYDKKAGEDATGEVSDERTLEIFYTETQGLIIRKNASFIQFKNEDESIFIKNGKTEDVIHINDDGISLGSEGISEEPAVLGDKNVIALEALSKQLKTLNDAVNKFATINQPIAAGVPFTAGLAPAYLELSTATPPITKALNEIEKNEIPATRSSKVTLDGPSLPNE